jgi:pimeloyl-ACP methyl ester carboxylesterase
MADYQYKHGKRTDDLRHPSIVNRRYTVFQESFTSYNDCRIRLRRGGQGPALLYLHGANGVPAVPEFAEALASNYDVIIPEHPGYGQSDEPEWLEDIHDLAYFYLGLLDQMKLEQVHVVGSSIGGWLAMEMAVRDPSRFASMVLVGSAGIRIAASQPGDIFLWTPEQAAANTYADPAIVARVLANPLDTDTTLKNRHTTAALAWGPRLHDPKLHKWLHRLKMPVRLAWGADDKIMPVAYADAFKALIPQASIEIYERCGHLPQVEHPARFAASTKQFIDMTGSYR